MDTFSRIFSFHILQKGESWVTRETAGTVDTKQATACTTSIFISLMNQKGVHSLIFNLGQVGDHAHPVFGVIPGIQLLQPFTWHFFTFIVHLRSC